MYYFLTLLKLFILFYLPLIFSQNQNCELCNLNESDIVLTLETLFKKEEHLKILELLPQIKKKALNSSLIQYWIGKNYLYLPFKTITLRNQYYSKGIQYLEKTLKIYEPIILKEFCVKSTCKQTSQYKLKAHLYLDIVQHLFLAYYMLNRYDHARKYVKKIVFLKPLLQEGLLNLIATLEMSGKDYTKYLKQYLQLNK